MCVWRVERSRDSWDGLDVTSASRKGKEKNLRNQRPVYGLGKQRSGRKSLWRRDHVLGYFIYHQRVSGEIDTWVRARSGPWEIREAAPDENLERN